MSVAVMSPNKPFWGARIVQIPFLMSLRSLFPGETVRIHTPVEAAGDFVDWGLADSVRLYRRPRRPPDWLGVRSDLRASGATRLFNLRRKSTGCCVVAAMAPGTRTGYGEGAFARYLDRRVPYDSGIYMSSRYLSLAEQEVRDGRDALSVPRFRAWADTCREPRSFGPTVLLIPGASEPSKRWPLDRFLQLAGRLAAHAPVTMLLGPDERDERAFLRPDLVRHGGTSVLPVGAAGNEAPVEILEAPGLPEMLARMATAEIVVSSDCGPSHLAQLSGRRFLGIYRAGWSTPADWFLDKANSDLIVSEAGRGWDSVPVARVAGRAEALLELPDYAGEIVRFSRGPASTPSA